MSLLPLSNYPQTMLAGACRSAVCRVLAAAFIVLALVATGCAGSDGGAVTDSADADASVGVEPDAPSGAIYVTTRDGDLVAVDPADGSSRELWDGDSEALSPVIEVAGTDQSSGLHVLLNDPDRQLASTLTKLEGLKLEPVVAEFITPFMLCLDPHPAAEVSMGHLLGLGTADPSGAGTTFAPVAFQGIDQVEAPAGDLPTKPSVVCPRWTSDRATVATAAPPDDDVSTLAVSIDGAAGPQEIVIDGCALTPAAFSPDDETLAIAATCYGGRWADSGLYLVSVDEVGEVDDLSAAGVIRLAQDNFGRVAWHPDGEWLVASRVAAVEGQTPATMPADAPGDLLAAHPESGTLVELELGDGDSPHSLAWLPAAVHG